MHALFIGIIYGAMTLGAGTRDLQAGGWKECACMSGDSLLGVRVMAISTDSRIFVTGCQRFFVHAIQRQVELLSMALLAGCVIL